MNWLSFFFRIKNTPFFGRRKEVIIMMKGYNTPNGYMGWLEDEGCYRLFSCEADYRDLFEDDPD